MNILFLKFNKWIILGSLVYIEVLCQPLSSIFDHEIISKEILRYFGTTMTVVNHADPQYSSCTQLGAELLQFLTKQWIAKNSTL